MRNLVFFLFFFSCVGSALGQTITDRDINRMKFQHERQTTYKRSAKSQRIPQNYLEMAYEEPKVKDWLLPYQDWEQNYIAYFKKHYGETRLTFRPSMIVMHYTVIPTTEATYRALSRREVSVHFMIGPDGTVYRLLPEDRRCTGAYGVNHVALSIEMVAQTESDLLSRSKQVFSSFCLVRSLMEKHGISASKVVAHYEVSEGKKRVPEYTDLHDQIYPDRYPPSSARLDPGPTYMAWLRGYLKKSGF
jgi:N-acetyl-anhydromuramyl-L-alanine amidase AmpD